MNIAENKISSTSVPLLKFREGGEIPQIGYGTYELSGENCNKGVRSALKLGYRHIDTASIYGNEQVIGAVLSDSTLGITRDQLFITSKINPQEQGYEKSQVAVKEMLARLKINYLDCVLIHWPGVSKLKSSDPKCAEVRLETWKSLIELKSKGLVRHIGVSNFYKIHLEHLLANSKVIPEMNQIEIHPLCQPQETIDFCHKNGIIVEAYSSLARQSKEVIQHPVILKIAKSHKKEVSQILLRWGLQNQYVIIPKSKTPDFIASNFNILDFELSVEEMKEMNSLNQNLHTCWNPELVTN